MQERNKKTLLFYTPVNLRYGCGFEEWLRKTVSVIRSDYHINIACGNIGFPLLRLTNEDVRKKFSCNVDVIEQIDFINILSKFYLIKPSSMFKLYKLFKNSDLIYFNCAFFGQELLVFIINLLAKKKVIVGFHAPIFFNRLHDFLFKNISVFFLKRFSSYHVINPSDKDLLIKSFGFKKVNLISNYLLNKETPSLLGLNVKKKEYLFAGRYDRDKGLGVLIKAIDTFLAKDLRTDIKFHFYGAGSFEDDLNRLAKKYNKKVINHGYEINKKKIFKNKYFLLHTSRFEPFGLVIIESMSYGVSPIATKTAGSKFIIKNKRNGYLMDRLTPEEIIKYINETLNLSHKKILKMSREAFSTVKREFSEEKFRKKFLKLLKLCEN